MQVTCRSITLNGHTHPTPATDILVRTYARQGVTLPLDEVEAMQEAEATLPQTRHQPLMAMEVNAAYALHANHLAARRQAAVLQLPRH
jgi:hypothetical protein